MPGEVPQVTRGARFRGVDGQLAIEDCSWIGYKLGPLVGGLTPEVRALCGAERREAVFAGALGAREVRGGGGAGEARRGEAFAVEVFEGGLVGGDHAGAGTGFDAHVADGHAAFHGERANGGAGVLDDIAGGAVGADAADDVEDDVLGGDAEGEFALDVDAEGLRLVLGEGLGGEDVLDLAGADAEGERAEGAVGGGVRVAADDGHAGLGEAELGADDVDDALVGGIGRRRARYRSRGSFGGARRPASRRSGQR